MESADINIMGFTGLLGLYVMLLFRLFRFGGATEIDMGARQAQKRIESVRLRFQGFGVELHRGPVVECSVGRITQGQAVGGC